LTWKKLKVSFYLLAIESNLFNSGSSIGQGMTYIQPQPVNNGSVEQPRQQVHGLIAPVFDLAQVNMLKVFVLRCMM
jgi:hypothetical protein